MADPHVPPPDPANFSWLEVDQTLNIVYDEFTYDEFTKAPLLSVTLRKIEGGKAALQVTATTQRFKHRPRKSIEN